MDDRSPVNLRCSVLVLRDEAVLLCRRTSSQGEWVLPGGTPKPGEGSAVAAEREVSEETGLHVNAERIAFVLEATNRGEDQHLVEIVFVGALRNASDQPRQLEDGLEPSFVDLSELASIGLRPPIGGYIRGFAQNLGARKDPKHFTGAYLGNVWRPEGEG